MKMKRKAYACTKCGKEEEHETNHWGNIYNIACSVCETLTEWSVSEEIPEDGWIPEPWSMDNRNVVVTQEWVPFSGKRLMRFEKYETMYGNIFHIAKGPERKGGSKHSRFITQDMAKRMVTLLQGPSQMMKGNEAQGLDDALLGPDGKVRHVTKEVYDNGMQAFQELADNLRKMTVPEFLRLDPFENHEWVEKLGLDAELKARARQVQADIELTQTEKEGL